MEHQAAVKTSQPEVQNLVTGCVKRPSNQPESIHLLRHLHQRIGNRALGRLIQTKLTISEPGDVHEQEADRIAEQVIRMPDTERELGVIEEVPQSPDHAVSPSELQRKCAGCQEEEELQRSETPVGNVSTDADVGGLGDGRSLSPGERSFFEPRFRRDFGHVRIHTGARAAESARSVNALAYTLGRNVVFGPGQYAPQTADGKRLLAHELTHVVQQQEGRHASSSINPLISSAPAKTVQRRVQFFVCNSADEANVAAAHGLPASVPVSTLRAVTDTTSETAANWGHRAASLLRVSPRSGTIRSAFHDAYAEFPEWVPPWFATLGVQWVDFGDLVAQRIQSVANILSGGWIQYYCWGSPARCPECTDSPPAYDACSSFLGRYLICLGPGFWGLWGAGNTDHMALILLHEALHIYFGTTVAHTGRSGNAFCYERFIAEANGRPIQPGDAAACPTA